MSPDPLRMTRLAACVGSIYYILPPREKSLKKALVDQKISCKKCWSFQGMFISAHVQRFGHDGKGNPHPPCNDQRDAA